MFSGIRVSVHVCIHMNWNRIEPYQMFLFIYVHVCHPFWSLLGVIHMHHAHVSWPILGYSSFLIMCIDWHTCTTQLLTNWITDLNMDKIIMIFRMPTAVPSILDIINTEEVTLGSNESFNSIYNLLGMLWLMVKWEKLAWIYIS